jgi:hypothetical protein
MSMLTLPRENKKPNKREKQMHYLATSQLGKINKNNP